jgi:hypothetical protein
VKNTLKRVYRGGIYARIFANVNRETGYDVETDIFSPKNMISHEQASNPPAFHFLHIGLSWPSFPTIDSDFAACLSHVASGISAFELLLRSEGAGA